jgi:hypothetical protein
MRLLVAQELFLRSVQNLNALVPNAVGSRNATSFCHALHINLIDLLLVSIEDSVVILSASTYCI